MNRPNPLLNVGFATPYAGTSDEVMKAAHLDWEVESVNLMTGEAMPKIVKSHKALKRSDNGEVLSVVGRNYAPIQNRSMFDTLTGLVDDGQAQFTHAGSILGGRRVFAVMELPDVWKLDNDPHVVQMLATTTHDGTGALRISPLATRVFCTNQINGFFWRGRRGGISIPHKAAANRRVEALRAALGLTVKAMSEYEEAARHMLDVKVSEADVDAFLTRLFPEPADDSPRMEVIHDRAVAARGHVRAAYEGEQGANIVGTAFGLFQSAVDYSDWSAPVRATDPNVRRMEKVIIGSDFAFKTRAFDLAAMAGR